MVWSPVVSRGFSNKKLRFSSGKEIGGFGARGFGVVFRGLPWSPVVSRGLCNCGSSRRGLKGLWSRQVNITHHTTQTFLL